jgi:hypothetical protein
MLKSKILSFCKIFEDNYEEIKAIPENYKSKSEFLKLTLTLRIWKKLK